MDNAECIKQLLIDNNADFEILQQDKPILSVQDASNYYDIEKSAPVFILETDAGLISYIKSGLRGKIVFSQLKNALNCGKIKLAKSDIIKQHAGYEIGVLPLVGLFLPAVL